MRILERIFLLLLSLALIGAGLAAAVYGGMRYLQERSYLGRSESATARVTRNHIQGSSGKLEYCPDL